MKNKKSPTVTPNLVQQLVRRISKDCLEIIAFPCSCGGQLVIKDWQGFTIPEMRYEASCDLCLKCDPNGYESVEKTVEAARTYFAPNNTSLSFRAV